VLIFRRTNCIFAVSGIVTLCKLPYSAPIESPLIESPLIESPLSIGALYGSLQSVTIPETGNIQFVLLKMSTAMLETC
jgi:hypothetical protein